MLAGPDCLGINKKRPIQSNGVGCPSTHRRTEFAGRPAWDADEHRLGNLQQDIQPGGLGAGGTDVDAFILKIEVKIHLQAQRSVFDNMGVDVTQRVQIGGGDVGGRVFPAVGKDGHPPEGAQDPALQVGMFVFSIVQAWGQANRSGYLGGRMRARTIRSTSSRNSG